jgi:hypothetical protein
MAYYVGAYAAAPKPTDPGGGDGSAERAFYAALRGLPQVRGLELPFTNALHSQDVAAFLGQLHPDWLYVMTGLPGVMNALAENPGFGLASDSTTGRASALAFCLRLRDAVATLNLRFGRQVVLRVELHSAPRQGAPGVSASTESLVDSLREVRGWDWYGAKLAIEHCDAYVQGQPAQKGFLRIDQELEALAATDTARTPAGIIINWGRSAIEGQDPATPLEHIEAARRGGRLCGVMFSGACAQDPVYGGWQDSHAPFAPAFGLRHGAERSLLTPEQAEACLRAAGAELDVLGLKIQPLPPPASAMERAAFVQDALTWLDTVASRAQRRG